MNTMSALQRAAVAFPIDWSHRRQFHTYRGPEDELGAYYVSWDPGSGLYGEGWNESRSDAHGVLLSGKEYLYHPIRIAQYALTQYGNWVRGKDVRARNAFLAQSKWLLENQERRRGIDGCYPFPFAWPRYHAPAGFLSAMAQGEAISVLLRAGEATGSETYLDAALRAAQPFRHLIRDGGVVYRSRDGDVIFEEAASELPAHILNGWIFAAWGLFELRHYASWAGELFDETCATLVRRLQLYDSGCWSYYCLLTDRAGFRRYATMKYHAFHIAQLHVLASMSGHAVFEETAQRWERYLKSRRSRAAVWANAARAAVYELLERP